jgi:hypothetical protein
MTIDQEKAKVELAQYQKVNSDEMHVNEKLALECELQQLRMSTKSMEMKLTEFESRYSEMGNMSESKINKLEHLLREANLKYEDLLAYQQSALEDQAAAERKVKIEEEAKQTEVQHQQQQQQQQQINEKESEVLLLSSELTALKQMVLNLEASKSESDAKICFLQNHILEKFHELNHNQSVLVTNADMKEERELMLKFMAAKF